MVFDVSSQTVQYIKAAVLVVPYIYIDTLKDTVSDNEQDAIATQLPSLTSIKSSVY